LIDQFAFTGEQKESTLTKVIEISGSGLKFTSFEPFRAGTLLKMDLIIPVTLQFRIELIAEVVRTEEIQETPNQDKYVIGARFVIIDEDSRDSIIKTVFKTHRRMIRMEKNR
jgi:c-di-GMP-binding flagellar brake protein YcgR